MTLDRAILLVSALATLAMAVFIYLTLREMHRQRKTSYRPDLLIPSAHIWGYYCNNDESHGIADLPNRWSAQPLVPGPSSAVTPCNDFALLVFNVGLGAARNIRATWTVNRQQMADSLAILDHATEPAYSTSVGNELLKLKSHDGRSELFELRERTEHSFSHLLPQTAAGHELRLPLPEGFIALASAVFSPAVVPGGRAGCHGGGSPIRSLSLELEYSDVGGGKHKKTMTFELSATSTYSGNFLAFEAILEGREV